MNLNRGPWTVDSGRRGFCLCAVLLAAALSASCGYALAGRGSFLPDYIRIVGVPAFENKTSMFDIDRVLTESVRTEFASRGRYTVRPDANNVDAILTGIITSVTPEATSFTAGSQASRVAIVVIASFEFKDLRTNKVLWSNTALRFREEYDTATTATGTDAAAFFGQNRNALQRLAQNFSRSVVTSILEAF
jgi:hypothetical protein